MSYAGSIVGRELFRWQGKFPTKLYIFRSYMDKIVRMKSLGYASKLLNNTLRDHPEIRDEKYAFAIAFAFGFEEEKTNEPVEGINIFSKRLRGDWKGNPMSDNWTFENGVYVPREAACETGEIILGKEGELRRRTKDLKSFLMKWPDIEDLYRADF